MRLLYLDWPHLPLRLALGRDPAPAEVVVLGGRPWDAGRVLDRSPAAGVLGVRRGQPLGTAHSLVPEALFLPPDAAALAGPMEAALDALGDLAPAVEGEVAPAAALPSGASSSASRGWHACGGRAGADAPGGGARGAAAAGAAAGRRRQHPLRGRGGGPRGGRRHPRRRLAGRGRLPGAAAVGAAAGRPRKRSERFRLLGLTRIGELAALDRSAVVARFGAPGGELHDLARGLDGRPAATAPARGAPAGGGWSWTRRWRPWSRSGSCSATSAARSASSSAARGAGAARATLDAGDPGARRPGPATSRRCRSRRRPRSCWSDC